jgi:hypothetical protein
MDYDLNKRELVKHTSNFIKTDSLICLAKMVVVAREILKDNNALELLNDKALRSL